MHFMAISVMCKTLSEIAIEVVFRTKIVVVITEIKVTTFAAVITTETTVEMVIFSTNHLVRIETILIRTKTCLSTVIVVIVVVHLW